MKLQSLIVPVMFGLAAGVMVPAATINITGQVKNTGGTGLSGAKVALARQNVSTLSGADGSFTLSGTTGTRLNSQVEPRQMLPYCTGNSIVFENAVETPVAICVVGLSGKTIAMYAERLPAGTSRMSPSELLKGAVPAAGICFVKISMAGESATFQLSSVNFKDGSATAIAATKSSSAGNVQPQGLAKSMAIVDTLVASLSGYDSTRLAITSFTGTYAMTLAASGAAGGPSAVTNLQLVNQGGLRNATNGSTNSLTNYQAIGWTAATAGTNPISKYYVYRNGVLYDSQATQTVFSGYISGTTLTVTSVTSGTILPAVRYSAAGEAPGTLINGVPTSGTAGAAGSYPVNISQTLGSAGSPVTFSAWLYIDSKATNSNSVDFSLPATIYSYNVAARDNTGLVGPQAGQYSVYGYQNGYSNWSNMDMSYGGMTENYASTTGSPQGGLYCLMASYPTGGGFQPTATAPQSPNLTLEIGAFNYLTIDINPGATIGYQLLLGSETRTIVGDMGHWHGTPDIFAYGPAPVANTWATYKVPLANMGFGISTFTGSISGTTLTVTAVLTNKTVGVDSDGFLTGAGIPAGTYISAYAQGSSIGTFTVAGPGISGSTSVASETMTFQRTSLYKFSLQAQKNPETAYYNNFGFTQN